jgi:hypothetical protein
VAQFIRDTIRKKIKRNILIWSRSGKENIPFNIQNICGLNICFTKINNKIFRDLKLLQRNITLKVAIYYLNITPQMKKINSLSIRQWRIEGNLICGKWVKLAANVFWLDRHRWKWWLFLDHKQGMFAINFFRCFGPHQAIGQIETGFWIGTLSTICCL